MHASVSRKVTDNVPTNSVSAISPQSRGVGETDLERQTVSEPSEVDLYGYRKTRSATENGLGTTNSVRAVGGGAQAQSHGGGKSSWSSSL